MERLKKDIIKEMEEKSRDTNFHLLQVGTTKTTQKLIDHQFIWY
jgi:hypothetical protein